MAAAPVQGTALSQTIYYAKNIAASASNTVTVTFSQAPLFPDVRIMEYNGLDTVNPLDAGGGASGTGSGLDSGPITLTSTGDLFIGAADVGDVVKSPGRGFTTVTLTRYGNDVEHTFPTGAGAIDATATQGAPDAWVMQGVGFRVSGAASTSFTVAATALSPVSVVAGGSATSTVTVTGSNGFSSAVALTCTGLPTGAACGPLSLTPGASPASGTLTITTMATTPAGTSTVTVTGTSGSVIKTTTVTLVVTSSGGGGSFTLGAASPASASVSPGGSTTSTLTVTGTGGFTGTVGLSCAVTPQNSPPPVCSLPASVSITATTTSATATLNISTTAATAALRHSSSIFYAMLLPLTGMTLLGASFGSRRKKVLGILLVFLMVSGLLFLASCSSGSSSNNNQGQPGTPAGTYTVTVTATPPSGTGANHHVYSNRKLRSERLMPAAMQASATFLRRPTALNLPVHAQIRHLLLHPPVPLP